MTREHSEPPCSSLTKREMVTELERLAITYPRTDMDPRKWMLLFETFWADIRHLTLNSLRDGCRRYRTNAANRFFPSPGQLLEACRDPFDGIFPNRPPALPAPEDQPLTADTIANCGEILKGYLSTVDPELKRPEIKEVVMTSELEQRERDLRELRQRNLERRLALKEEEQATGRGGLTA